MNKIQGLRTGDRLLFFGQKFVWLRHLRSLEPNLFQHIDIVRRTRVLFSFQKTVIILAGIDIVSILPALVIFYAFFPAFKGHILFCYPKSEQIVSFHKIRRT